MDNRYSEAAPVKVKLLQGPIYAEDAASWKILVAQEEPIAAYFRDLGLSLMVDKAEGWGYLEQQDMDGEPTMIQLFKRRALSFEVTLLLVILREELLRFDSTPRAIETVPSVSTKWLIDELSSFVPEQNNAVKRDSALRAIVKQGIAIGVLREILSDGDDATYQILRIVKAKLPEAKIAEIKERLKAPPIEEGDNGDQTTE